MEPPTPEPATEPLRSQLNVPGLRAYQGRHSGAGDLEVSGAVQVTLTERLKSALTKNRHLRGDRVLWRDDGREKVTQVLLAKWMSRAQRRAGLKATGGIHILRHTFCSRLAMAGASTKAIQELAGHEQISTTQRYMHLSPAAKSEAISLLDRGEGLKAEGAALPETTPGRGAGVEQTGAEGGA